MTALPAGPGKLAQLEELDISGCCRLTGLPVELGRLTRLEKLDLSGCSGLMALIMFK
ncbi:hypothetical protein ED839_20985 [Escherichia coli]|uniref:leucine-rich repeat domain-containing protein n=1 Tax=Enterobacteriaceae TaxID=543 RepID=UPI000DF1FC71|nr:hypothetical protein [Escherichia coli]